MTGSVTQEAGETARSAKEQIKQQATETGRQIREQAMAAGEQLKHQASDAAQQFKERSRTMASEQKERVADEISGVGAAIRDAAHRLHDDEDHNVARYTEALANQVDKVSGYLRNRDIGGLMHDCEDVARRRPEVFIGGMFVTGLAIARFLKASRRQPRHNGGFRQDFDGSSPYRATTATGMGHETWSDPGESHRPFETASTGSMAGMAPASSGTYSVGSSPSSGLAGASVTSAGYGASTTPDIPEPRSQSDFTHKPR
jgi:gas vesicle protein